MEANEYLNSELFINTLYNSVYRMDILGNGINNRPTYVLKLLIKYSNLLKNQIKEGNDDFKNQYTSINNKINKLVLSCSEICK